MLDGRPPPVGTNLVIWDGRETTRKAIGRLRRQNKQVLREVDLDAPPGYLWLPFSMGSPVCWEMGQCEAILRFCRVDIKSYQDQPWKYPMLPMLMKKSGCTSDKVRSFLLSDLRDYRAYHPEEFLQPTGFIYHETRTGSTLVANMLAHVPTNLVASENRVSEEPIRSCSGCSRVQQVELLRDILPLLGRTTGGHTHSFFKLQDATSIPLMSEAFPEVPWIYLFRDPVEVMVSNLKGAYGKKEKLYTGIDFEAPASAGKVQQHPKRIMSPCLTGTRDRQAVLARGAGTREAARCAARLMELCQAAAEAVRSNPSKGMVVEYTNLPDVVTSYVYAVHFGMGAERLRRDLPYMQEAARMYSKSMARPEAEFTMGTDKRYKEMLATEEYRAASSNSGLEELYNTLKGLQIWTKEAARWRGGNR